jgi:toxin ParE1/3/4
VVRFLPAVEEDVEHVLLYTAKTFGMRKYVEYAALIEEALEALADNPEAGRKRPDIHPEAWTLHIAKPGRRARHLLLYRVAQDGTAVIHGLFYDAMDLPQQWRQRDP